MILWSGYHMRWNRAYSRTPELIVSRRERGKAHIERHAFNAKTKIRRASMLLFAGGRRINREAETQDDAWFDQIISLGVLSMKKQHGGNDKCWNTRSSVFFPQF